MTDDTLLLIGRETPHARDAFETHAQRLRSRDVVDSVRVALYEHEPARELSDLFAEITADTVYALPMFVAHVHDTTSAIPGALSYLSGDVRYCEPIGRSSAITSVLAEQASDCVPASDDTSLLLVGFGSSSAPYQRQTAEYHAARLREWTDYGEVVTCYLLQNPAVECARYNVSNDRVVAVPLFVARNPATEEEIPAKLELDRGGIAYADTLGTRPGLTDAIHAEVETQRVFASARASPPSFEASLAADARALATDGRG